MLTNNVYRIKKLIKYKSTMGISVYVAHCYVNVLFYNTYI